jgi:16S rRNA (cytidine1402-2'-O)-methyltransferase
MLYILSTPIGNLEDLSSRAKRILGEADLILAEDTRQAGKLIFYLSSSSRKRSASTLGIPDPDFIRSRMTSVISFHEHSDARKLAMVIGEIKSGKDVVYLTDAGTPNLSDPGGKLVEAAMTAGIAVSPIPGPSALTALISVAPFSCQEFIFKSYFPKKKGREKMIEYIKSQKMPVYFFESPHRIQKTLEFLAERLPGHKILIGRELTKRFEQIVFCHLTDGKTLERIIPKGEFVLALVKD